VHRAHGIMVLTIATSRVTRATMFMDPGLLATFGLPPAPPPGTWPGTWPIGPIRATRPEPGDAGGRRQYRGTLGHDDDGHW